jgi:L-asparaginase/beta-aspartyl-peptidase (threonine type)
MWAIGIHGGAGPRDDRAADTQKETLAAILAWAEGELAKGATALDTVEGAIRRLEDSGLFIAGKGSRPNKAGGYELDASIMDGKTRRAGAVAALVGAYPPISIARAVMERTPHVLLAGEGARQFALAAGFAAIEDPGAFFDARGAVPDLSAHGTVGAVALDQHGAIAAGTSTGGTMGKLPGRVGDSPIVGAGTWADDRVGVSCTGRGEYFMRTAAAHAVAMRRQSAPLAGSLDRTLAEIAALGGAGGILAVDAEGTVRYAFNAASMRVALATSEGRREAGVIVTA